MLSKATSATQVLSKSNLSRAEKRVKSREASRESCTTGKDQRTFFFFFFHMSTSVLIMIYTKEQWGLKDWSGTPSRYICNKTIW